MIPSPKEVSRFPVSKELRDLIEDIKGDVSDAMHRHESFVDVSKERLPEPIADFILAAVSKEMVRRGWNVQYRSAYSGELGFCWRINWTPVISLGDIRLLG